MSPQEVFSLGHPQGRAYCWGEGYSQTWVPLSTGVLGIDDWVRSVGRSKTCPGAFSWGSSGIWFLGFIRQGGCLSAWDTGHEEGMESEEQVTFVVSGEPFMGCLSSVLWDEDDDE